MTKIIFGSAFSRSLKKILKRRPDLEKIITSKFKTFQNDPFDQTLRTHKLKGDLSNYRSFSINSELRVVFEFTKEGHALFSDIGTHDEVY